MIDDKTKLERRMLYNAILHGNYYQTSEKGIIGSDFLFHRTGAIQIDISARWPVNKAIFDRAIEDRTALSAITEKAFNFIDNLEE